MEDLRSPKKAKMVLLVILLLALTLFKRVQQDGKEEWVKVTKEKTRRVIAWLEEMSGWFATESYGFQGQMVVKRPVLQVCLLRTMTMSQLKPAKPPKAIKWR